MSLGLGSAWSSCAFVTLGLSCCLTAQVKYVLHCRYPPRLSACPTPCLACLPGAHPPCRCPPCRCSTSCADCALLFQAKALLTFEPGEPLQLLSRAFASGSTSLYWDVSRLPSRTARAYIVTGAPWEGRRLRSCFVQPGSLITNISLLLATREHGCWCDSPHSTARCLNRPPLPPGIGLLWVGLGGALLLATEFLTDTISLSVYYALAAACVTVGAFTTHGLAGFLRHSDGSTKGGSTGSTAGGGWRFWQPFRGGTAFVLAQVRAALPAVMWPCCHVAWGPLCKLRRSAEALLPHMLTCGPCLALHPSVATSHSLLRPPAGPGLGALLVCAGGLPLLAVPSSGGGGLLVRRLGARRWLAGSCG